MPDLDTLLTRASERLADAQRRHTEALQVVNELAPQILHLQGMVAAYRSLQPTANGDPPPATELGN